MGADSSSSSPGSSPLASSSSPPPQQKKGLSMMGVIAAMSYMTSATSLILFNKVVLSTYKFPYPNVVLLFQLLVSTALLLILSQFQWITFFKTDSSVLPGLLPPPNTRFSMKIFRKTLPLSISYLAYLVTGMVSLAAVSIPIYTTLHRLSTLFVMGIEYYWLSTRHAGEIVFSVSIMALGALLAGVGDLEFDILGYALVMLYNLTTAIYLVSIGRSSKDTPLNSWGLMFYNNLVCGPALFLITATTGEFQDTFQFQEWGSLGFQVSMLASILLAFALNFTIFWNTATNSPLTQSVAGQVKDFATIAFGLIAFGSGEQEPLFLFGIAVGLGASAYYAYCKYQAARRNSG